MDVSLFVHIANLLFLLSYLVRDIFLLRILSLLGGFMLLPYYIYLDGGPLVVPILWSFVFSSVNIYQMLSLFKERKPVVLNSVQQDIFEQHFSVFTPKQFEKLYHAAQQVVFKGNQSLLLAGHVPGQVIYLVDGFAQESASISIPGPFFGLVQQAIQCPLGYDVVAQEPSNALIWESKSLNELFDSDLALKSSWQRLVTNELCTRLN